MSNLYGSGVDAHLDVVIFVADAFRLDALGFDHPASGLRSLEERFEGWVRFDHCFSAAPWTLPACTSLLSGQSASRHRHFIHGEGTWDPLVEMIRQTHTTVGIVNSSVLARNSSLDEGFDSYEHLLEHDDVFAKSKEAIATSADRPRFFFIHSNLAHDYFRTMSETIHTEYFPDDDDWYGLDERVNSWRGDAKRHLRGIRNSYRACALRLSERFQDLLEDIDLERTVVVFIADHGEGFDPDRARIHHGGRLHDDLIHIPLAMHVPQSVPQETRAALESAAKSVMGTVDVFPTILGILGLEVEGQVDGRDLTRPENVDGSEVLSSMDGRYLYLRNRYRMNVNLGGRNTTRLSRLGNRILQKLLVKQHLVSAFIDWPHKLIVTEVQQVLPGSARGGRILLSRFHSGEPLTYVDAGRWFGFELFDLASDPDEAHNLLRDGVDAERVFAVATSLISGDHRKRVSSIFET